MSFRLLANVLGRWEELDGYAAAQGLPELGEMPLSRLCNYAYWKFIEGADPQWVDKFRSRLWMPPKGVVPDARSPWSAENETAGFAALQAQVGQKRSATK